ncbi:b4bcdbe2-7190-43c9-8f7c-e96f3c8b5549 [Sclerotinia trifoliorum]|uniref:B4bcdbe2-7190-43c9-8f7c-e96f3c8b5549 n=1 Tax=Sclerotinia trifoliorum TaxID=28548 RepID=A0A8H2ZJS7_9HELO|nr:b4bcdbe2-7190-43c9-8f7c-e96f3c8b5549 [Sclerotinia trifoliorum]
MSNFPASFGRGEISQHGARKDSLAEEIMNATMEGARNAMEKRKSSSGTDELAFGTHYSSDIETSKEEYDALNLPTETEIPKKALLPSEQPLIPFEPARLKKGERAIITPEIQAMLNAAGVQSNPKYEGEITAEVLNDLLTPENENCALHITCIHPKAEMKDLFPTIHHGKVYSVAWNAPNSDWPNAAARLCFCVREAAEKYLEESETGDGIRILGQRISVEWNRNKKCPVPEDHQSRVIQLRGPRSFGFSAQDLLNFFGKDMKLHIISRREWNHKTDQKVVELAFCGIRAQSRMAFRCFKQKIAAQGLGDHFDIRFAPDLCDPNADQGKDMFMSRPRTPRIPQAITPPPPPPQRTLESIRASNWRSGQRPSSNYIFNGGRTAFNRLGPKYEKGAGPDAKSWRPAM